MGLALYCLIILATIHSSPSSVVVYHDGLPDALMDAFESLAVIASESMQHQTIAEIYRSFAASFGRLPQPLQRRAEDLLLRSLSALGDHVPTARLDDALSTLISALTAAGRIDTAEAIHSAQTQLASNIGRYQARSTRVG